MKLTIHDVGHGTCISLRHNNDNVMLWDCGHKENCHPSVFLPKMGIKKVHYFFVSSYNEDRIRDLPNLRKSLELKSLLRNRSITGSQLRELKKSALFPYSCPITEATESLLDMIDTYNGGPFSNPPSFPGVKLKTFWNNYNNEFENTNDISLVTFLQCGNEKFIFPGDLEKKGWDSLLSKNEFKDELKSVTVFLASHYGRENGYCKEVFNCCKPKVVVFSDSNVQHDTRAMVENYAQHAQGIFFDGEKRHVLSTRKDGSLIWSF